MEIVPIQHTSSLLQCDEDTLAEVQAYKELLMRYFHEQYGQGVVCVESARRLQHTYTHASLDVIPINKLYIADVSIYFKQVQ